MCNKHEVIPVTDYMLIIIPITAHIFLGLSYHNSNCDCYMHMRTYYNLTMTAVGVIT